MNTPEKPIVEPKLPVADGRPKYVLWVLVGGMLLLTFFGGWYFFKNKKPASAPVPQAIRPMVSPSPSSIAKPRSKAPGIVVGVVTARGIDPKTGEAVEPTTTFLTTDKSIYAVTTLINAKVGTKIEYVRYLNGKFLDNRSITITKPNTNNTSFVWTLKNLTSTHPIGQYEVRVYTNGIFEKKIFYTMQ